MREYHNSKTDQRRRADEYDRKESRNFLIGLGWGLVLSVFIFWYPMYWWMS